MNKSNNFKRKKAGVPSHKNKYEGKNNKEETEVRRENAKFLDYNGSVHEIHTAKSKGNYDGKRYKQFNGSLRVHKKQIDAEQILSRIQRPKNFATKGDAYKLTCHAMDQNNSSSIKVYFLGGLGEVGKNFTAIESGDDMIIVDCGMAFPDDTMPGVDLVLPDFTFVERNINKIRALVVTHGHEDHIGAVPYLLKRVKVPIYSTLLTLGLIDGKFNEHGLQGKVPLFSVKPGEILRFGEMLVEFIHVNHSISDSCGLAIHTKAGILVHTGDFKIDCTPHNETIIDLGRFAELGRQGVLCLLADSTNAERSGYTPSEKMIGYSFETLFALARDKRMIVATFASNISRVQQIINCAVEQKRKVALSGRSMVNVMGIASALGYLEIPDGYLIDIEQIRHYAPNEIVIITTGSQGEPMSALSRMAFAGHKQVEVGPNDYVVISAKPIPGNERTVSCVVNELLKRGCEVVLDSNVQTHVSGHASSEELKIMHSVVRPHYFLPVHGEQVHLRTHAELAVSVGCRRNNIYIGDNGKACEISYKNGIKLLDDVPAGNVLVDGLGIGDVGSVILRDRKHLSEDGIIVIAATVDSASGSVIGDIDVQSRGFIFAKNDDPVLAEACSKAFDVISKRASRLPLDVSQCKNRIRDEVGKLMYDRTHRSPMILPVIMEI